MIPVLFEANVKSPADNAVGRLHDCLSAVVSEERNGIYELEFEYPVGGYQFDRIQIGRVVGVTHDEAKDVQLFDIVGYTKPIDGVVTFHCVHISYRLTKAVVTANKVSGLSNAINKLNNNIQPNNLGFKITTNKTGTGKVGAFNGLPQTVRSIMGGMEGSILDTFGGEWEFDNFTAKLWNRRGQDTNFRIRYGVNMTEYEDETDYLDSFNAVTPYWSSGDDKYVQLMLVGGGVMPSGRIENVPLDLTSEFEHKPRTAQEQIAFFGKAAEYMSRNNTHEPVRNIKVSFVRLSDSSEYEALSGLQQCRLCDTVTVEFAPYGMSGRFKVVKTVWDVLLDRYEEIELGTLSTNLSTAVGVSSGGSGSSEGITKEVEEVDTNLILTSYGRYRLLEFHGFVPDAQTFATLSEGDRPSANQNGFARWANTSGRYFPALLRVGTDGAVSASYFDSNTTTNSAISSGTLIGQLSWIV